MSSYDYIIKIIEPRVEDNCYICLGIFWLFCMCGFG